MDTPDLDALITQILESAKIIAIVGMSAHMDKASFKVGMFLKTHGYTIFPVNPNHPDIKGIKSYPTISAIPRDIKIDIVQVFRKPEYVLPHVKEALDKGIGVIWLQPGIVNEEAAAYARERGATVVMNHCMMGEYHKRHPQQGGRIHDI